MRRSLTLLLVAAALTVTLTLVSACRRGFFPSSLEATEVPESIRSSRYKDSSDEQMTIKYSNIEWHVAEVLDDRLIVASTANRQMTSARGRTESKLWTIGAYTTDEPPDRVISLGGSIHRGTSGTFAVDIHYSSRSPSYAAGIAWDKRIVKVVGKSTTDIVVEPVNGFWYMEKERGSWLEFLALDSEGKVIFTATPPGP